MGFSCLLTICGLCIHNYYKSEQEKSSQEIEESEEDQGHIEIKKREVLIRNMLQAKLRTKISTATSVGDLEKNLRDIE